MTEEDRIEIQELLPFWVNGTLEDTEMQRVEAAIRSDPELLAEAEVLRAMRTHLKATHEQETGPGEFGLARLHRALDGSANVPAPQKSRAHPGVWALGSALAASLVTVLVLGPDDAFRPSTVYEQASGDPAAVIVTFDPNTTVADISALVRAAGLTIIDGPSAMGVFRMVPLPDETASLAALAAELEGDERVLRVDIKE